MKHTVKCGDGQDRKGTVFVLEGVEEIGDRLAAFLLRERALLDLNDKLVGRERFGYPACWLGVLPGGVEQFRSDPRLAEIRDVIRELAAIEERFLSWNMSPGDYERIKTDHETIHRKLESFIKLCHAFETTVEAEGSTPPSLVDAYLALPDILPKKKKYIRKLIGSEHPGFVSSMVCEFLFEPYFEVHFAVVRDELLKINRGVADMLKKSILNERYLNTSGIDQGMKAFERGIEEIRNERFCAFQAKLYSLLEKGESELYSICMVFAGKSEKGTLPFKIILDDLSLPV